MDSNLMRHFAADSIVPQQSLDHRHDPPRSCVLEESREDSADHEHAGAARLRRRAHDHIESGPAGRVTDLEYERRPFV